MQKKRNKKKQSPRKIFIVILLAVILSGSGWWVWRGLYPPSPRFNSLLISRGQELQQILPGETVLLRPSDRVKIHEISTNILLNINVRLAAEDFDINALRHEELDLSTLLPDRNIFNHYRFRVWVKYRNQKLGHIDWDIQPYVEDWLEKARKTEDAKKRLAVLEQGLQLLPEDTSIWRRLLEEYKAQKRWKRAASMLEKAVEKDANEELLAELLEVYAAMSSKTKIISVLRKLIKLDPEDLSSRLQLAEMLEKSGKNKSAIKEYEELAKRVDKKERLSIYKSLGYLYSKTGKNKKAISYYLKAAKSDQKDANLYYNISYLYEKTKQNDKSIRYLEKAVGLNKKDMDSRLVLADKFFRKGELKKADKYVSAVLKKQPSSLKALFLKARIEEKKGKGDELKKVYEKIYALDKKNATVIYNLGVLYYEKGDLKSSLSYFLKYSEKNPKDPAVHELIFDIYKQQDNEKMAFKEARTLAELKPDNVQLYHYMFDYLSNQGEYQPIIPIMQRGVKANPGQTDLKKYLLTAYLKTGKNEAAVALIDQLLDKDPHNVDMLMQKAGLQEKGGDVNGALETYKKIINISADNEEAEAAYLRLRLKTVRNQ